MDELQFFENPEFGTIRAFVIGSGLRCFVGKDVAKALGYERPMDAVRKCVASEDKWDIKIETPTGAQKMTIINEFGLYSLILSSKLPTATKFKFKRWVTHEVLPFIRKTDGDIAGKEQMSAEELIVKALIVAQKMLADREARISALTAENQIVAGSQSGLL